MYTTANAITVCPNQIITRPVFQLCNGIRISSEVWWLFVHLCGYNAVDQMMLEPDWFASFELQSCSFFSPNGTRKEIGTGIGSVRLKGV